MAGLASFSMTEAEVTVADYHLYSGNIPLSQALWASCPPHDPRRAERPEGRDRDILPAAKWDAYLQSGLISWHACVAPEPLQAERDGQRLSEQDLLAHVQPEDRVCSVVVWQNGQILAPKGKLPAIRVEIHPAESAYLIVTQVAEREDFFGFHRVAERKVWLAGRWVSCSYFQAAPEEATPLANDLLATPEQVLAATHPAYARILVGNLGMT